MIKKQFKFFTLIQLLLFVFNIVTYSQFTINSDQVYYTQHLTVELVFDGWIKETNGTGFFISNGKKDNDDLFLVTAHHLLKATIEKKDDNGNFIKDENDNFVYEKKLGELSNIYFNRYMTEKDTEKDFRQKPFLGELRGINYKIIKDIDNDILIICMKNKDISFKYAQGIEYLMTRQDYNNETIKQGDKMLVIGFPLNYSSNYKDLKSPVYSECTIANEPSLLLHDDGYLIVNGDLITHGSSGGPLITNIHKNLSEAKKIRRVINNEYGLIAGFVSLGHTNKHAAIVPSFKVLDLLKKEGYVEE